MPEQKMLQSSEHPPAQPSYILRGHSAQVHAVHFFRSNARLLTGDADGWVVLWSLSSKRAVAVWKPHTNTILGVNSWGDDRILTHGRDGKIHVWQLREEDEKVYSKILPIDIDGDGTASTAHKQPWLLHSLPVNALNFCSFGMLELVAKDEEGGNDKTHDLPKEGILLGTPGFQDGSINITSLPDEKRIATIAPPGHVASAGMIMAIGLVLSSSSSSSSGNTATQDLLVLAGYESGHACIWRQAQSSAASSSSSSSPPTNPRPWQCIYTSKSHSQPILSLGIAKATPAAPVAAAAFYTSSADAIIARHSHLNHTSSSSSSRTEEAQTLQTRHAGQQSLKVRNDNKIFATAGWDGRVRVYSVKGGIKEVAVLKWHKEGCYAVGFADVFGGGMSDDDGERQEDEGKGQVVEQTQKTMTVSAKREARARSTHWLAAGSKDGKVSLWDIY